MKNAERILAAYTQAEPWKADHDAAMQCFEMEEILAVGDLALRLIFHRDAAWQEHVASGKIPYKKDEDVQIGDFYKSWVEVSERMLSVIKALADVGFVVNGADDFELQLEEARSLLDSRILETEMRPVEDILPLVKGNPRPERYGK